MTNPRLATLISGWNLKNHWVDYYLSMCSDDVLRHELTPEGNTGVWILGHLVTSDDDLSIYLGAGPRLFPEYESIFQGRVQPQPVDTYPPIEELRERWKQVCAKNDAILNAMSDADLDAPHAMVEGDPEEDYFRNKQGCILNWTAHQLYHVGQLGALLSVVRREREKSVTE